MTTDRYAVPDDQAELEQTRLRLLGATRDPRTFAVFARAGVGPGWHCLEVGAGAGTVTAWLAAKVGSRGSVLATDIETRFHAEPPGNVTLLRHDIVNEPLPRGDFDLVHARAVLQHIPEREVVLDTLLAAARPGGTLVVEESDFRAFEAQPLPEPYATVHQIMSSTEFTPWREPHFGSRLVSLLRARGLDDIDVTGDSWAMRPGEPAGDWWFLAVERTLPTLQRAGLLDQDQVDSVRRIIADPGLVMLSPLSLAIVVRTPT